MAPRMDLDTRPHLITHSETQLKYKTGRHNIWPEGLKEREKYVNKTKHFEKKLKKSLTQYYETRNFQGSH